MKWDNDVRPTDNEIKETGDGEMIITENKLH
jgi:hypothetical protein